MESGKWRMGNHQFSIFNYQLSIVAAILLSLVSCSDNKHAEHQDTYTCPMHPTVVSDRPSTCPVCGMDLVRKAREGEEVKITEDLARLLKSPNESIIASITTVKPEYKSMPVQIEVSGIVTYDTRTVNTIPARISGRLEKVYLQYVFQPITKGQRIADVYSPELITAQREFLYLLEHDADNASVIESAKSRLQLLGMTESQINTLIQKKEPSITFTIYSPYTGYLIPNDQQAPIMNTSGSQTLSTGEMNSMGGSATPVSARVQSSSPSGGELIREGSYVTTGQTLFKLVNTSSLRIELNLLSSYAASIKKGDAIELDFKDIKETAKVDFIQPFFSEGEEFLKLRVYLKKMDGYSIGKLVSASILSKSGESLWVPKEAILDLGTRQIVFIKERGVFKAKNITTGIRSDGWIEVKKGLLSSEELASSAQYLVDSESFVKTN